MLNKRRHYLTTCADSTGDYVKLGLLKTSVLNWTSQITSLFHKDAAFINSECFLFGFNNCLFFYHIVCVHMYDEVEDVLLHEDANELIASKNFFSKVIIIK